MPKFNDANGREWRIAINVGQIKKVRDLLQLNIYELIEQNFDGLSKLMRDYVKLVDVVFVLCEEQARVAGISDVQFGESLGGQSLNDMSDAFIGALIDFFPDRRMADILRKMVEKTEQTMQKAYERNAAKLDGLSVDTLLDSLSATSGSSPAS